MQALGPVALVSLLLNDGLTEAVPGSDINQNPNLPEDPELQERYNRAAVQVHLSQLPPFLSGRGPQSDAVRLPYCSIRQSVLAELLLELSCLSGFAECCMEGR